MGIKLKALVQWLALAAIMAAAMFCGAAKGTVVCNMDMTKSDELCRAAITGQNPPRPTKGCCAVIRHANFPCLCELKYMLPSFGIDPKNAFALPAKCGLQSPHCPGDAPFFSLSLNFNTYYGS
ncbi:putative lipid-transfer protein DIR1 [Neltuma alba]|uniref:putative lipid-transfer protein DIR1 n=1 Tax=Neltuma alba TaxID=207710 RepID=UPI0010A426A3|nr:putative lipid-transfer protein DIR1 [Prosopis alba]